MHLCVKSDESKHACYPTINNKSAKSWPACMGPRLIHACVSPHRVMAKGHVKSMNRQI